VPSDLLVDVTNAPSDLPVLLWFSRYNPMKGPDFFIDLVAELKQRGICFKAVMAGTDENGLFLKCKRRAENEQLGDVLSVLPALEGEDRSYILQRSDIFILPTHGEGFSMAILEAMACKAAVVATKDANFPEMVEAGAGYELEKNDINGFVETVEELIQDPVKRIKIAERAFDLISKQYGWAQSSKKYECLAREAKSRKECTP
jgi:glycosyltransferase involved in cell wall biosynthesis